MYPLNPWNRLKLFVINFYLEKMLNASPRRSKRKYSGKQRATGVSGRTSSADDVKSEKDVTRLHEMYA